MAEQPHSIQSPVRMNINARVRDRSQIAQLRLKRCMLSALQILRLEQ